MLLRSGLNYESDIHIDKKTFLKFFKIDIKHISELDLLFINDFCNIFSKLNYSNQFDKIQNICKMYSLLYTNRDSILNIYYMNTDFINFISLIYDKSNNFTHTIIELIPEYKDYNTLLLNTLYYLHKMKIFIENEFNI